VYSRRLHAIAVIDLHGEQRPTDSPFVSTKKGGRVLVFSDEQSIGCEGVRLLIIEDDDALCSALRDGLAGEGFAVDTVATAADASARLYLDGYDCIVLDLGLPDRDGTDFLRDLRADGWSTPVLVLTARSSVEDRVAGLNAGADDYVAKPFAFPELVGRLRALVRRGMPLFPVVLRVGDLELDPGRLLVSRAGVPLPLTAKEFAILECLMRHAGQLVTRTMLLDQCWDASYEGLSNLVDVHVSRVRRKLESTGGAVLLHTVRGAGFILDEDAR
jgi:two-component system OmpR family response regulator